MRRHSASLPAWQVGLIAINVIGHPGSEDLPPPGAIGGRPPLPGLAAGAGGGSVGGGAGVNDLAVDMGMDPETAALLRDVSRRKEAAVASEEYELVRSSAEGQ